MLASSVLTRRCQTGCRRAPQATKIQLFNRTASPKSKNVRNDAYSGCLKYRSVPPVTSASPRSAGLSDLTLQMRSPAARQARNAKTNL
jgi:hypothetical protein